MFVLCPDCIDQSLTSVWTNGSISAALNRFFTVNGNRLHCVLAFSISLWLSLNTTTQVKSDEDDADDDEMTCALPPQLLYCVLTRPQSGLQERQLCRQRCGDTGTGLPRQPQTHPCPYRTVTQISSSAFLRVRSGISPQTPSLPF